MLYMLLYYTAVQQQYFSSLCPYAAPPRSLCFSPVSVQRCVSDRWRDSIWWAVRLLRVRKPVSWIQWRERRKSHEEEKQERCVCVCVCVWGKHLPAGNTPPTHTHRGAALLDFMCNLLVTRGTNDMRGGGWGRSSEWLISISSFHSSASSVTVCFSVSQPRRTAW